MSEPYYVIETNSGYFITQKPARGERIVFRGSWYSCRKFIDPNY